MNASTDLQESAVANPPMRIVTDWKRFSNGLWRVPQGDISAAYCGDVFPKLKVFIHEGKLFTNCGNDFSGPIQSASHCHLLIRPDEYSGPELVQYSHEGAEGKYKGRAWRLGPKIIFESNDPTVPEWIWLFRVLYADGGLFARNATYQEFITKRLVPVSANERVAHQSEVDRCAVSPMPKTQSEMRWFLIEAGSISLPNARPQLELSL